ncbi:hypothetical protein ACFRFL_38100 [Streptomyces sp. NPDC056708]
MIAPDYGSTSLNGVGGVFLRTHPAGPADTDESPIPRTESPAS